MDWCWWRPTVVSLICQPAAIWAGTRFSEPVNAGLAGIGTLTQCLAARVWHPTTVLCGEPAAVVAAGLAEAIEAGLAGVGTLSLAARRTEVPTERTKVGQSQSHGCLQEKGQKKLPRVSTTQAICVIGTAAYGRRRLSIHACPQVLLGRLRCQPRPQIFLEDVRLQPEPARDGVELRPQRLSRLFVTDQRVVDPAVALQEPVLKGPPLHVERADDVSQLPQPLEGVDVASPGELAHQAVHLTLDGPRAKPLVPHCCARAVSTARSRFQTADELELPVQPQPFRLQDGPEGELKVLAHLQTHRPEEPAAAGEHLHQVRHDLEHHDGLANLLRVESAVTILLREGPHGVRRTLLEDDVDEGVPCPPWIGEPTPTAVGVVEPCVGLIPQPVHGVANRLPPPLVPFRIQLRAAPALADPATEALVGARPRAVVQLDLVLRRGHLHEGPGVDQSRW